MNLYIINAIDINGNALQPIRIQSSSSEELLSVAIGKAISCGLSKPNTNRAGFVDKLLADPSIETHIICNKSITHTEMLLKMDNMTIFHSSDEDKANIKNDSIKDYVNKRAPSQIEKKCPLIEFEFEGELFLSNTRVLISDFFNTVKILDPKAAREDIEPVIRIGKKVIELVLFHENREMKNIEAAITQLESNISQEHQK